MISTLLLSGPALGEQPLTSLRALSQEKREAIRPLIDASFHFRMQPGIDCTGTYISESGHFLTALHCIAGCLAKNHALASERASDEPLYRTKITHRHSGETTFEDFFVRKITVDDDRVDEGVECPARVGQKQVQMKVIMTGGKGWLAPKDKLALFSKKFPDDYKALLEDGYEHRGDFAIVQVQDQKSPACLSLTERAPEVGKPLQAVSFPCLRRGSLDVDGTVPLFTSGRRTSGFRQSEYFKSRGEARIPFDVKTVERGETFFSTLDIEKCGSGTALVDESMAIAGLATRVYKTSTRYESGSLEAIDVAQVWREIREKKSGGDLKEITGCKPHPPVKLQEAVSKPPGRNSAPRKTS